MDSGPVEIARWETAAEQKELLDAYDFPKVVPASHVVIDYEGSLYEELDAVPSVARLNHIEQLGMTSALRRAHGARHSRYVHSLTVATALDHLAQEFGLDRELAVTAGMMHDIATPPYSDAVAKPLGLDDQEYFRDVLEADDAAMRYLDDHGIDADRLDALVRGDDASPLGQLVSSSDSIDVDRWAYVVEDGRGVNAAELIGSDPDMGAGHRYAVDPFESMAIVDGTVAFQDVETVGEFLELRAEMFEAFYRHPSLMAKEAFLGRTVREMWDDGLLDADSLFRMTDQELRERIHRYAPDRSWDLFRIDGFARYGRVDADGDAVDAFLATETDAPFEAREPFAADPAVETPVLEDGEVLPYRAVQPEHAADLAARLSADDRVAVYGREDEGELVDAVGRTVDRFGGKRG